MDTDTRKYKQKLDGARPRVNYNNKSPKEWKKLNPEEKAAYRAELYLLCLRHGLIRPAPATVAAPIIPVESAEPVPVLMPADDAPRAAEHLNNGHEHPLDPKQPVIDAAQLVVAELPVDPIAAAQPDKPVIEKPTSKKPRIPRLPKTSTAKAKVTTPRKPRATTPKAEKPKTPPKPRAKKPAEPKPVAATVKKPRSSSKKPEPKADVA